MRSIFTYFLLLASTVAYAQPSTEVYVFDFSYNGNSIKLSDGIHASSFNPDGYNNQPHFRSPNELYITSNHFNKGFTDIVRLDLVSNTYYRVTETDSLAEYSPTPDGIRDHFTVVRVEKDGRTQSLHAYPHDHSGEGYRLLPDNGKVGYHKWLSDTKVALFLITNPISLVIADIETGEEQLIAESVGRCLQLTPEGNLYYVQNDSNQSQIRELNINTLQSTAVISCIAGSGDYAVTSNGTILMGSGSKLYQYNPAVDSTWKEIDDLSEDGINKISRLAVSRNRLAIINSK